MKKELPIFKSLADETRIRILKVLEIDTFNVNELINILKMGQSRVSRHLKILQDSKLIISNKVGSFSYYGIEKNGDPLINKIYDIFEKEVTLDLEIMNRAKETIESRKKSKIEYFDSIADRWENLKQDYIHGIDYIEDIKRITKNYKKIVDLGCGTGDILANINSKTKYYIGIDSSLKMLKIAKKKVEKLNNVEFRHGEIESLPIVNEEVDFVMLNMVLHHFPKPMNVLKETTRILKSDGRLLIIDFVTHKDKDLKSEFHDTWSGFSKSEIEKWVSKLGMKKLNYELIDTKNQDIKIFLAYSNK